MEFTEFDKLDAFYRHAMTLPVGEALVQTGRALKRLKVPYFVFSEEKDVFSIKTMVEGKCSHCQDEGEVVPVKAEGLDGLYCKKHLWEIMKYRSPLKAKKKTNGENGDSTEAGKTDSNRELTKTGGESK